MKLLTITVAEFQELRDKLEAIQNTLGQSELSKEQNECLDTRSVCKILKISPRTLQKFRDLGRIPFYRLGSGIIRYKLSDIEYYLEKNYNYYSNGQES